MCLWSVSQASISLITICFWIFFVLHNGTSISHFRVSHFIFFKFSVLFSLCVRLNGQLVCQFFSAKRTSCHISYHNASEVCTLNVAVITWHYLPPAPLKLRPNGTIQIYYYYYYYYVLLWCVGGWKGAGCCSRVSVGWPLRVRLQQQQLATVTTAGRVIVMLTFTRRMLLTSIRSKCRRGLTRPSHTGSSPGLAFTANLLLVCSYCLYAIKTRVVK